MKKSVESKIDKLLQSQCYFRIHKLNDLTLENVYNLFFLHAHRKYCYFPAPTLQIKMLIKILKLIDVEYMTSKELIILLTSNVPLIRDFFYLKNILLSDFDVTKTLFDKYSWISYDLLTNKIIKARFVKEIFSVYK